MKHPGETILAKGRFLDLVTRDGWEYARRPNATAVVAVLAVTPAGELLLVEQPRIPVGGMVIELPAGLVGDEDAAEKIEAAAARELEEETGWTPAKCTVIATGPSSPGLTSEMITLVRAEDLRRSGAGGGVAGERITVHAIPLAEVPGWLAKRAAAGAVIDHKVYAGLWWLGQARQP
jgi:ADP-ribose pyrophosphatase